MRVDAEISARAWTRRRLRRRPGHLGPKSVTSFTPVVSVTLLHPTPTLHSPSFSNRKETHRYQDNNNNNKRQEAKPSCHRSGYCTVLHPICKSGGWEKGSFAYGRIASNKVVWARFWDIRATVGLVCSSRRCIRRSCSRNRHQYGQEEFQT